MDFGSIQLSMRKWSHHIEGLKPILRQFSRAMYRRWIDIWPTSGDDTWLHLRVRHDRKNVPRKYLLSASDLWRVFDADFAGWLLAELRAHDFPIGDVAKNEALRKQRRVEQMSAVHKQRAENRRARLKTQCAICRAPMVSVRGSKEYCSARCRQRAHRRWADETGTSTGRKKQRIACDVPGNEKARK